MIREVSFFRHENTNENYGFNMTVPFMFAATFNKTVFRQPVKVCSQ